MMSDYITAFFVGLYVGILVTGPLAAWYAVRVALKRIKDRE